MARLLCARRFGPLSQMRDQFSLPQSDRFGRDLDQFIILNIGHRLFHRQRRDRRQPDRFVLGVGPNIAELFAAQRIDVEIIVA